MPRQLMGFIAAAALQLVALVLAHELVFLARYGSRYGEALVHAGHGETWAGAVTTSLGLGVALFAIGALRLAYLGLLVRHAGARSNPGGVLEPRPLLRAWLRVAPRTAGINVVLLTIQENVERASIGQGTFGPGILLSPEYAAGLWITIAVGLVVGLVAALFDWRRRALLARLRAARAAVQRRAPSALPRSGVLNRLAAPSILGRRSALRAPPLGSAT